MVQSGASKEDQVHLKLFYVRGVTIVWYVSSIVFITYLILFSMVVLYAGIFLRYTFMTFITRLAQITEQVAANA